MPETSDTFATRESVYDVLLVGNPNTGKTSVFNSLTGLRQKTGNYPGVTVEKKTGIVTGPDGATLRLHDMPGMYSLTPKSLDDSIAREVLIGEADEELDIRLIVVVADASNLNRNLYLVTQLIDLGIPVAVAMNMMDNAVSSGVHIDLDALSEQLQVPIVPVVASRQQGIDELRRMMFDQIGPEDRDARPAGETDSTGEAETASTGTAGDAASDTTGSAGPAPPSPRVSFAERFPRRRLLGGLLDEALAPAAAWFGEHTNLNEVAQTSEALRVTSSDQALQTWMEGRQDPSCKEDLKRIVEQTRGRLDELQVPWRMLETILRYDQIDDLYSRVVREDRDVQNNLSVRLDRAFTHRVAGPVIVLAVFALVFQSIFSWAEAPMTFIEDGIAALGAFVYQFLPAGLLRDLLVDGVIAGVGAVLVFLPQILFLFFFLALLEDTGYMARVAFIMDRFMKSMGLSGHSVMPLLSSFACAIPGIMATRTIKNWKDRLITIMIAPLMSCSARLPVYILLIGAFFPSMTILGVFTLQGLMLFSMYIFGIVVAIGAALVFKRFFMKDAVPTSFVMELPPYRRPSLKWVLLQMFERARVRDGGGPDHPRHIGRPLVPGVLSATRRLRFHDVPVAHTAKLRRPARPADRTGHRAARVRLESGHRTDHLLCRPGSAGQHYGHDIQRGGGRRDLGRSEVLASKRGGSRDGRTGLYAAGRRIAHGVFRAGLPVHGHGRHRETGDQRLEMAHRHGPVHDGPGLRGVPGRLPGGIVSGVWITVAGPPGSRRTAWQPPDRLAFSPSAIILLSWTFKP